MYDLETNAPYTQTFSAGISYLIKKQNQHFSLQANVVNAVINLEITNIETGQLVSTVNTEYQDHLSTPEIIDASCKTNKKGELVCRILVSTVNGALFQIQAGRIRWTREESLANIAAIEMIDLPLSDAEGAIEKQLKSKGGRFFRYICQITDYVFHFVNTYCSHHSSQLYSSRSELQQISCSSS